MSKTDLLSQRIIFLHEPITRETSNRIIEQLLYLDAHEKQERIDMYINSPGGSVTDGIAIIDTMHCIQAPVSTICTGQAASMAAWVLAAGAKGQRFATPNAEIMIHQVWSGISGQTSQIEIYTNRLLKMQERLIFMLSEWTKQTPEKIKMDMERDYFMSANEAKTYGIIDDVLVPFNKE